MPVIEYFTQQGKVRKISCEGSVQDVYAQVKQAVESIQ